MKKMICLLLWLCTLCARSQKLTYNKGLKIGDRVPTAVRIYLEKHAWRFSPDLNLKNKIIIIDYWATYCGPCIEALPSLNKEQAAFKKDLAIFIINRQSKKGVDSTLERRPALKRLLDSLRLIPVYGDKLLNTVFQHITEPHEVWIDKNGVVVAVTGSNYVTATNIRKLVEGRPFSLPEKKENFDYKPEDALLPQLYGIDNGSLKYYTALLPFIPGLWGGVLQYSQDSINRTVRITRPSLTLLELYGIALSSFRVGDPYRSAEFDFGNRVVLTTHDSTRFFYPGEQVMTYEDWENQYSYCYESVQPIEQTDSLHPIMVKDLNRYFGINARIEKRRMHCLVLVPKNDIGIRSDTGIYRPVNFYTQDSVFIMRNNPLSVFRNVLSAANRNHIFLDETGYKNTINISISSPLYRIDQLREELNKKYGIDIIEADRDVDMIVISD